VTKKIEHEMRCSPITAGWVPGAGSQASEAGGCHSARLDRPRAGKRARDQGGRDLGTNTPRSDRHKPEQGRASCPGYTIGFHGEQKKNRRRKGGNSDEKTMKNHQSQS
jgi:hypothetical protein